jgi:hypothetical protein
MEKQLDLEFTHLQSLSDEISGLLDGLPAHQVYPLLAKLSAERIAWAGPEYAHGILGLFTADVCGMVTDRLAAEKTAAH